MNDLFSKRHKYSRIQKIKLDKVPRNLRNRLWNKIQKIINSQSNRDKIIESIWDKFYEKDVDDLNGHTSYE